MYLIITHQGGNDMGERVVVGDILWNDGHTMPILELITPDETVYLAPFRWYKFQVSKTADGEWDLGSSMVIEFEKLVHLDVEQFFNTLLTLAYTAVYMYCMRKGVVPPYHTEKIEEFIKASSEAFGKYYFQKRKQKGRV